MHFLHPSVCFTSFEHSQGFMLSRVFCQYALFTNCGFMSDHAWNRFVHRFDYSGNPGLY